MCEFSDTKSVYFVTLRNTHMQNTAHQHEPITPDGDTRGMAQGAIARNTGFTGGSVPVQEG